MKYKYIINRYERIRQQNNNRNSQAVQGLTFCTSTAGGTGLICGQGAKIPQAAQHSQ